MYVLFEGIDTCGKSTQIDMIEKVLEDVVLTKEPGGTSFGLQAREILLQDSLHSKRAELLLFLADRAEHYEQVIKKNSDKLLISDRGFLSGIGYALANGDFEFNHLFELNKFALEEKFPDLIILFITNMKTLKERMEEKKLDGIELRGLAYLILVQTHMEESLKKMDIPYLLVDATDTIDNIHNLITQNIKTLI